jgi:hypothetical protein
LQLAVLSVTAAAGQPARQGGPQLKLTLGLLEGTSSREVVLGMGREEDEDMTSPKDVVRIGDIQQRILMIRGEKVVLDADLADFYGVATKRLNEQVKRNKDRFPEDFGFRLTEDEKSEVVAKCDHLHKLKYSQALPLAFTEHGALMAASVLSTERAVEMSVFVVRAFVAMRRGFIQDEQLSHRLDLLERQLTEHDNKIRELVEAIRQLMAPKMVPINRRIGFRQEEP